MPEIRPYDLVRATPAPPAVKPLAGGQSFESFLGAELSLQDAHEAFEEGERQADGGDLEYLAAELACRQWLTHGPTEAGTQAYPIQTAYFLRNQRRPEDSPLRAMRLGGMLKAAALQQRSGMPATGTV